jgi:hypothetical protein
MATLVLLVALAAPAAVFPQYRNGSAHTGEIHTRWPS